VVELPPVAEIRPQIIVTLKTLDAALPPKEQLDPIPEPALPAVAERLPPMIAIFKTLDVELSL
jgi:hypothetical protein